MKRRTKVLLADDHAIASKGLAILLKSHFDLVGTVGDGSELIDLTRKLRPEVIVDDIAMSVLSGLETVIRLVILSIRSNGLIAQGLSSEPHSSVCHSYEPLYFQAGCLLGASRPC